jgi:divinyl protochlorophyllide a 8-vinyl-reductase
MSEEVAAQSGVIGPNAILQLLPVLDRFGGPTRRAEILALAGILDLPDGTRMIPEADAARLHRQLRWTEPGLAPVIAAEAGVGTANYILAHRIPTAALWLLKALPTGPAARLLSRAIARHAWTFIGSGRLDVVDPWTYDIWDNPLIKGEQSATCLCDWHAGVFARLYQELVNARCRCTETSCGARDARAPCRFEIRLAV